MWLEQLARNVRAMTPYEFPFADDELDFRPLLRSMMADRLRGRDPRKLPVRSSEAWRKACVPPL